MKVRLSQIDEGGNGKPKYTRKHNAKGKNKPIDDDDEESDDDLDEFEGSRPKLLKTMINFKSEGITISAWDLHTIETDMRFVEKPKAHFEYGIIINKGLNAGQYINKTDLSMWYSTEELRDERLSLMLKKLTEEGLNVIEI